MQSLFRLEKEEFENICFHKLFISLFLFQSNLLAIFSSYRDIFSLCYNKENNRLLEVLTHQTFSLEI